MTYLEAAETVLRKAKRPLTSREVSDRALELGLVETGGKTPEATMSATLYVQTAKFPDGPIQKIAEPGPTRARRGSVRWVWRQG